MSCWRAIITATFGGVGFLQVTKSRLLARTLLRLLGLICFRGLSKGPIGDINGRRLMVTPAGRGDDGETSPAGSCRLCRDYDGIQIRLRSSYLERPSRTTPHGASVFYRALLYVSNVYASLQPKLAPRLGITRITDCGLALLTDTPRLRA